MLQYLWIGLGGFIGANTRYLLQQWAANHWGAHFPYGTLVINVSGSFVIGLFLTLATGRLALPPETRLFVAVGFLGGYTTFSSFSYETLQLLEQGQWGSAALYFLGNIGLGMLGVFLGVVLARLIEGGQ
jgi:fluoride exporter